MEWLEHSYRSLLERLLRRPEPLLGGALLALGLSFGLLKVIGTEFMPKLEEGNIWLTITLPAPISLSKAKALEETVRGRLESFPESRSVLTQLGRPEDGTDPKGFNNLEILIALTPRETWRYGRKDELVQAMNQKLADLPGVQLNLSQVIQDNVEEAVSGV